MTKQDYELIANVLSTVRHSGGDLATLDAIERLMVKHLGAANDKFVSLVFVHHCHQRGKAA